MLDFANSFHPESTWTFGTQKALTREDVNDLMIANQKQLQMTDFLSNSQDKMETVSDDESDDESDDGYDIVRAVEAGYMDDVLEGDFKLFSDDDESISADDASLSILLLCLLFQSQMILENEKDKIVKLKMKMKERKSRAVWQHSGSYEIEMVLRS